MGLDDYNKKRDFEQTPEPAGEYEKNKGTLRFVIQRHQARRLHYDLRLEMEGVLKSWAVPKGPSMNPSDKRLAIHTEDHPIKYLHFEGTIPKGNYGAGEMKIWDQGSYESASGEGEAVLLKQYEEGNLKLNFKGTKIQGVFALVRTSRGAEANQWLLIKKGDDYATDLDYDAEDLIGTKEPEEKETPKEKPGSSASVRELKIEQLVKPMLATKASDVVEEAGWLYELKWDGYRALCNIKDGKVDLYSRNGLSFKHKFPELYQHLQQVPYDVILDGEIVSLDQQGRAVFQNLQNYQQNPQGELRYYVFDLLYLNGHDIKHLPLVQRKSLIPAIVEDVPQVFYCDHVESMGKAFYEQAVAAGVEGIIAKFSSSQYIPGVRSDKWLKVKAWESQEALICGYTASTDRGSPFGSLVLGINKEDRLQYIGNCGTGFDVATKEDLYERFQKLETQTSPFPQKINLKGREATWLEPELICEVQFTEWTRYGTLRHPSFKGLRNDKMPAEINVEEEVKVPVQAPVQRRGEFLEIDGIQVPVSNLEKVYWPEQSFTKYDLVDYYLKLSSYMLPYLKDRPQNLHRHPNGIKGESFYQKDTAGIFPHWLNTVKIHSKSGDRDIEYVMCQNEASLIYMANLGCIEINPWSSRIESLENPDFTVIDIDPSDKNTFEQVIEVALATKQVLDQAGITGYVKTSGSSGIHVYLPLDAEYTYDEAREFTRILCYLIHELLPDLTSMERNTKKRPDKIYLDFLQNRRGQTLAAPYCARPRPGATVSTPLRWEEVKPGLDMKEFTIKTVPQRMMQEEDHFAGVLEQGIDISTVLDTLSS